MTELEKVAYAKSFIDKLADGINPLDDKPIPESDVVNNIRLSRCFSFVSDILDQVCKNGMPQKEKIIYKSPLSISVGRAEKFEYSKTPISIKEMARRIN